MPDPAFAAVCFLSGGALALAGAALFRAGRPVRDVVRRLAETEGRLDGRLAALGREGQAAIAGEMSRLAVALTDGVARVREETRARVDEGIGRAAAELRSGFEALRAAIEERLGALRGEVEARLSETVARNLESFGAVAGRLEELHRATGQVVALSAGIDRLNRALASPKGRGAFGELSLSQLLRDLLPAEHWCEQWPVEDGTRVDAAILLRDGAIPIDAKFTVVPGGADEDAPDARRELARAIEARAREIAQKYVRPPRTLEFAFMYLPAESVFHRVILDRDLHQRLLDMRVVPTSPNSLYAYLQALAVGLRGLKIEEKAREIERLLAALRIDFGRFAEHFRKLGSHLDNAHGQFTAAERDVSRFRDRLDSLRLASGDPVSGEPLPSGAAAPR